jgi:uncharacterized membrane protein YraQ (UPF0718 family)
MLWETLWALVLGLAVSACVQVFVRKTQMERVLGGDGLRQVALATLFGAASSSCSYAAAAAGHSVFKKGAGLVPSLAFMFASTNIVFELGAVLWLLMGWRFVLAEFVGAFLLIAVMWLLVVLTVPKDLVERARRHEEGETDDCCHGEMDHGQMDHGAPIEAHLGRVESWRPVGSAFLMDASMLWKEVLAGFIIAGFITVLVPVDWWQKIFLQTGPHWLRLVENAIVGPIVAALSFVCSVGNIPLASTLWSKGIGFGGVISFIYGDLIVIPLILIYRKYYGLRFAATITGLMFASMVASGVVIDLIFDALGLIPGGPRPRSAASMAHFGWNATTWLDLAAILVAVGLVGLGRRRRAGHRA